MNEDKRGPGKTRTRASRSAGFDPVETSMRVIADRTRSTGSRTVEPVRGAAIIGTKKLSTIRKDLEKALAPAGGDPIRRLERQIAYAKRKGDRTEILEGLTRFLESPRKEKRAKHRARAKE